MAARECSKVDIIDTYLTFPQVASYSKRDSECKAASIKAF